MHRKSLTAYGAPLCETVVDVPRPQGSEVLVRIERCGVCHSDLHMRMVTLRWVATTRRPRWAHVAFTLGHEIAGTVEARDRIPIQNPVPRSLCIPDRLRAKSVQSG
jgi:alcohol dehydrogenase